MREEIPDNESRETDLTAKQVDAINEARARLAQMTKKRDEKEAQANALRREVRDIDVKISDVVAKISQIVGTSPFEMLPRVTLGEALEGSFPERIRPESSPGDG